MGDYLTISRKGGNPEPGPLPAFWPFMVHLGTVLVACGYYLANCICNQYNEPQGLLEGHLPV